MSISLSVFKAQVDEILQASTDEISGQGRREMIKAALERYSRDAPDTRTEDVSGDGGKYYVLSSILDRWVESFSTVDQVQYPAPDVSSDEQPVYLDPEEWDDNYWAELAGEQTRYLYLPNHSPAVAETMRITYTLPYVWQASSTTTAVNQVGHGLAVDDYIYESGGDYVASEDVRLATHRVVSVTDADNFTMGALVIDAPQHDFFAICNLAACICCQSIAVRYSSASDTTINADSTAHTSKAGEFSSRAKELCGKYKDHMGLDGGVEGSGVPPAGAWVNWETGPDYPSGRRYLFRRNR